MGASSTRAYLEYQDLLTWNGKPRTVVYWTRLDDLPDEIQRSLKSGQSPWQPWWLEINTNERVISLPLPNRLALASVGRPCRPPVVRDSIPDCRQRARLPRCVLPRRSLLGSGRPLSMVPMDIPQDLQVPPAPDSTDGPALRFLRELRDSGQPVFHWGPGSDADGFARHLMGEIDSSRRRPPARSLVLQRSGGRRPARASTPTPHAAARACWSWPVGPISTATPNAAIVRAWLGDDPADPTRARASPPILPAPSPDLFRLASAHSPRDPLLDELRRLAATHPLAEAGIPPCRGLSGRERSPTPPPPGCGSTACSPVAILNASPSRARPRRARGPGRPRPCAVPRSARPRRPPTLPAP